MSTDYLQKKPMMSWESLIKIGIYIGAGAFGYANMSNKIEQSSKTSERIEETLKEEKKNWNLQRAAIETELKTCQIQLSALTQRLDDKDEHNGR